VVLGYGPSDPGGAAGIGKKASPSNSISTTNDGEGNNSTGLYTNGVFANRSIPLA